jgi:hypothetical protein
METILSRSVGEISAAQRQSLENLLGHPLQQNQRVFIMVLDPTNVPSCDQRGEAARGLREIISLAERHANEHGISEAEVDAAVDETMDHVRRRTT